MDVVTMGATAAAFLADTTIAGTTTDTTAAGSSGA